MRHDVPYVVVPAGTRNHFALDLGLDRDDVVGALDAYADGVEQHDRRWPRSTAGCSSTTQRSASTPRSCSSPEYRDAKGSTFTSMLPELLGPDAEPLDLRFHGPDGSEHSTADMILVSNDPYQLDMRRGGGTRQRLDRGVLGIATLRISTRASSPGSSPSKRPVEPTASRAGSSGTAPEFRIDSDQPL